MIDARRLEGKTLLVTGATGFVGRAVLRRLADFRGVRRVSLSRSRPGEGEVSVTCALEDLTPDTWKNAGITEIDYVLHLGGFTPKTQTGANDSQAVFMSNILGTERLLASLPGKPIKLVYSSAIDVYAVLPEGEFITENTQLEPVSLYGASKAFGETQVRLFAQAAGIDWSVVRLGHIYGPGEEAYKKVIPEMIRGTLAGEAPLLWGAGDVLRDFLYVDDLVEYLLRALLAENVHGPLNLVRGESISLREVAEAVVKADGRGFTIRHREVAAEGRSLRFRNSAMRAALGEHAFVSFEEGILRELAYSKNRAPTP